MKEFYGMGKNGKKLTSNLKTKLTKGKTGK